MKVIYVKNILDLISEAIEAAREERRTIDRIELEEREMEELVYIIESSYNECSHALDELSNVTRDRDYIIQSGSLVFVENVAVQYVIPDFNDDAVNMSQ